MALNQNQFDTALDIVAGDARDEETYFVTIRQIRMVAWARTGQFNAIIDMMRVLLDKNEQNNKFSPSTSIDVADVVEKCLKEAGTKDQCDAFNALRMEFSRRKLITNTVRICQFYYIQFIVLFRYIFWY